MKTCIFGGTFDPIHKGHIHIAKNALSQFGLDKVIFMPSGCSYMKKDVTPAIHRLNMLKLALEGSEGFEVSDLEIKREGYTYTKDTVEIFKKENPDEELYFLIGTDTLFMLEKWYEPEYLFDNLIFLVADRNDENSDKKAKELSERFNADIRFMNCDFLDISSTKIRQDICAVNYEEFEAKDIDSKVYEYIKENHLYKALSDAEMITILSSELKESRLIHTLGVIDTASALAKAYGADVRKCEKAALLHDCAKYMPKDEQIEICERNFIKLNDFERKKSALLHSKAGACLAYEKYGITDTEILDAIKYHTTGKPDMSLIEKIIFVSDFIEPGRTHSDKLPMYRMIAMADLDLVCMNVLKDTIDYLNSLNEEIDSITLETYSFYKELISKR
ncbi:MAG: nicotinate-nucleotide adenylyltransferase [Lachnospiraceae bacterium]|nr:nicotinate-nucleotide adenylyltransferase [Lachnospiraceae bacterium]